MIFYEPCKYINDLAYEIIQQINCQLYCNLAVSSMCTVSVLLNTRYANITFLRSFLVCGSFKFSVFQMKEDEKCSEMKLTYSSHKTISVIIILTTKSMREQFSCSIDVFTFAMQVKYFCISQNIRYPKLSNIVSCIRFIILFILEIGFYDKL